MVVLMLLMLRAIKEPLSQWMLVFSKARTSTHELSWDVVEGGARGA